METRNTGLYNYRKQLNYKNEEKLQKWLDEKHRCECCGKILTEYYGSGRFCSRKCANTRTHSKETKSKIQKSITKFYCNHSPQNTQRKSIKRRQEYELNPKKCVCCGIKLSYEQRNRKTCSSDCLQKRLEFGGRKGGRIAAAHQVRRSKNEIAFCMLCEDYFGKDKVMHNIPMFNGWDADVILPELKIAILWNGPWHYRKVTKTHNLQQVQNRDKLKIREIYKCGFVPYIIKDTGANKKKDKVIIEFKKFLQYANKL